METPRFASAAVAAPHSLASAAGRAVLAEGGNALEAMVAMAATIAVVYPHMNGIGGDGFWLVREANGKVHAIEACGPAGSLATIRRFRDKGYDALPVRGIDAALTVPGAIGGWMEALALSGRLGGKMPARDLLHDAISHAREGYPISASEARYWPKDFDALLKAPGFAETLRPSKEPLPLGQIRKLPALAATLEHLAKSGLDDFYRGDVGRELAADASRIGLAVTRDDLAAYRARMVAPLSMRLPGVTVMNFPPPTQGLTSLMILGLFEALGVTKAESFDHHHGLVEASKLALMVRNRVITDPDYLKADLGQFLNEAYFAREAAKIDRKKAAAFPLPDEDGDTIWMGAIDGSGLAVSYIQSIYWEYGSGCVMPKTGVLWQNRGISFSLDEGALNPLTPGRKPFHTLNPPLAVFDDGRVASYGTMGGDGQPQFLAQVFTRYRFGQSVAAAVDAPRWLYGKTWGANETTLKTENRFDHVLLARFAAAGHSVQEYSEPYHDQFGHAGLLVKFPDGHVEATHDPRADGGAMGL